MLWIKRAEALIIFVALPLLIYFGLIPIPVTVALWIVAGYCGWQLWQDPAFSRGLLQRKSHTDAGRVIIMRSLVVAAALLGIVWIFYPDQLFAFPAEQPIWWMLVMLLYPILSALPQEFIYRTFFFHRYDHSFELPNATVLASAAAFSFMHIAFFSWWAVGLGFVAGVFLGLTYQKTDSLFWVIVEHSIYGWLVITLGLGIFINEAF